MGNHNAGDQCKGGHYFKVDDGFAANLAHFFQVIHPTDAQCDGEENDGKDELFDDIDELGSQDFHLDGCFGFKMSEQYSCDDGQ